MGRQAFRPARTARRGPTVNIAPPSPLRLPRGGPPTRPQRRARVSVVPAAGTAVYADRHALAAAIGLEDWSRFPVTLFRMGVTGHVDEGPSANGPYVWNGCRCDDHRHDPTDEPPDTPPDITGDTRA